MRILILPVAGLAAFMLAAAAPTPEQAWKAGIEQENVAYAQKPHAMLKIQDSAYIGEGQSAVLAGRKGVPGSWRWSSDPKAKGILRISLNHGQLSATKDGKPVDPKLIAKSVPIDSEVDIAGQATQVGAGVEGWRIFVYNQRNPEALNFKGVSYFPFNPAWRLTARFVPEKKPLAHVFRTSRGTDKQFYRAGEAVFTMQGKTVTLPLYTDSDQPSKISDMSSFFTDKMTGQGAYGAGRYVDVDAFGKFPPAKVALDFNQAYNPNCARSAHFTCPIAIDEIPLEVRAGERDPHYHGK